MQRRLNSAKVEADGYKAREKTLKAQLDEVSMLIPNSNSAAWLIICSIINVHVQVR